jgi:hypothetical protein
MAQRSEDGGGVQPVGDMGLARRRVVPMSHDRRRSGGRDPASAVRFLKAAGGVQEDEEAAPRRSQPIRESGASLLS